MDIKSIAKEMAEKYQSNEFKWVLALKRLEHNGYSVVRTEDLLANPIKETVRCSSCGEKIPSDKVYEYQDKPYCCHCIFSLALERNKL